MAASKNVKKIDGTQTIFGADHKVVGNIAAAKNAAPATAPLTPPVELGGVYEKIDISDPTWAICLCGNVPSETGHYPVNIDTMAEQEPDEDWDGIHYFCGECFRVWDMETGFVVAHPESVTFLP
jgi:hypothetical protein